MASPESDSNFKPAAEELGSAEVAVLLPRVVERIERKEHKPWVEICGAVVIAMAALASAWCAFQSSKWGGVQTFRLTEGNQADQESHEAHIAALQYRGFDASVLVAYYQAKFGGNTALADVLQQRFRPVMKAAFNAWQKTDPFNNPQAPATPFLMPEYAQEEIALAKTKRDEAAAKLKAAHEASDHSDAYVLLTVVLAIVLMFAGIAGTFDSPRLRQALTLLAVVLFVGTMCVLATMPYCRE